VLIKGRVEVHQEQSRVAVVRGDRKPEHRKIQLFDEGQQGCAFAVSRAGLENRGRVLKGAAQQCGDALPGEDVGALGGRRQPAEDNQTAVAHGCNFTSP